MEKQEVMNAYLSFQKAMVEKNLDELKNLTSIDKTFTHMSGKVQSREEFFADIMNGNLTYYHSTPINIHVTVKDDIGVVTGTNRLEACAYGIKGTFDMKVHQVFKKVNGKVVMING